MPLDQIPRRARTQHPLARGRGDGDPVRDIGRGATAAGATARASMVCGGRTVSFGHGCKEGCRGEDLRAGDWAFGAVGRGAGGEGLGRGAEDLVLGCQALDFALEALFLGQDACVGGGEVVELNF